MSLSCNMETEAQQRMYLFGQVLLKRWQLQMKKLYFSKFQTSYNPFNSNSYTQINITVAKLFSGKKKKKQQPLGYFIDPSKLTQPNFLKGRKSVI